MKKLLFYLCLAAALYWLVMHPQVVQGFTHTMQHQGTTSPMQVLQGKVLVATNGPAHDESWYTLDSATPDLSASFIDNRLCAVQSPACGQGSALVEATKQFHINAAYALAFFWHESNYGTRGEATSSLSLGNLRCIPNYACIDGYAWFHSWQEGFVAYSALIRNLYINTWGLRTVRQIIHKYAPAADNNDENAYVQGVELSVDNYLQAA